MIGYTTKANGFVDTIDYIDWDQIYDLMDSTGINFKYLKEYYQ